MSTFITRFRGSGAPGLRLAVKDCIDVAGVPTTVGSPVLAERAERVGPPRVDAACLEGARFAGAQLVGKTNLHELCYGRTGVNAWFGTPANPLDPAVVPGGSSSGSAVAVATGEADVAFGTDTLGSIRNPSAWCGTVGLKTTYGRVPLDGVWPLAPSMDAVGPMARDVAGVVAGMGLLEPGFSAMRGHPDPRSLRVGRLRGIEVHPAIDAAVDAALRAVGFTVVEVRLAGWANAGEAAMALALGEALEADGWMLERSPEMLGPDVRRRLQMAAKLPAGLPDKARDHAQRWRAELAQLFDEVDLLASPGAEIFPPSLDQPAPAPNALATPINLAGGPALVVPIPVPAGGAAPAPRTAHGDPHPASLQLAGPDRSEALILAAGASVETAVGGPFW